MTEIELSLTLGLVLEPADNKVKLDPLIKAEITYLKSIFEIANDQSKTLGKVTQTWTTLLPWHSLN